MPNFINLSSDEDEEDEELPFLQTKNSAVKVGKRLRRAGSGSKSVHSDEDDSPWLKRKIRRVETSSGVTTRAERQECSNSSQKSPNRDKKPPLDTRKPTRKVITAPRSAKTSSTSTPSSHVPSLEAVSATDVPIPSPVEKSQGGGQESVASISPATKPAPSLASGQPKIQELVTQSKNAPSNVVEAIPQPQSAAQEPVVPQPEAPLSEELPLSELPSQVLISKTPEPVVKNTSAQPRVQVPDALRSAIAQVVSQRQELLNSRWGRRQSSFSDSDYAPSDGDDDEDDGEKYLEEDSGSANKDSKRRNPLPSAKDNTPAARSIRDTTESSPRSAKRSAPRAQDASTVNRSPSSRQQPTLTAGHIPPLLNLPRTIIGETNLERKRTFFQAKKLAFEQFESICEGELQQLEVELLRREMETRESFAQKEIQLQRMNIRAEVIHRMVLAGASVDDISERLTLL
ncbi:hypothetical protein PF010_g26565 [Phytophthora fragariae]|uniref:Uncharacterized protein n=1 Tax=Phytophthora fragariae TaxID=53985 RepID=A0A6A3QBJ8_9STRA|nr:hypothetical protein PF010_g26565 [Phytophthora fragariae]KAE9072193.1 hypothetical protein PF007_g26266 [Phytophthora fragariae]KAE9089989.1 hypothetical protein PF006_g25249 [Phytophthora fragariae]KAE9171455.1 hypothetical protein PF004_g27559 [Phytophthora fragariae]